MVFAVLINCANCGSLNWVSDHPLPGDTARCLSCRNDLNPTSEDATKSETDSAPAEPGQSWPAPNAPGHSDSTGPHFEFFKRGCELSDSGSYQEALAAFDEALRLSDGYVWAYARRGHTYLILEQYRQAIALARRLTHNLYSVCRFNHLQYTGYRHHGLVANEQIFLYMQCPPGRACLFACEKLFPSRLL